jgi:hypothetical protein
MLNDPERGDTYMRVTDGIHTDAFKAARLEMGAGLGGLVAKTGMPYHSTDYHKDTRFRHTVDELVAAEGLIAIQGVPLKIRDQVIGVLFAANRHARPFTQQEVARSSRWPSTPPSRSRAPHPSRTYRTPSRISPRPTCWSRSTAGRSSRPPPCTTG